jgi:hypothetical protein
MPGRDRLRLALQMSEDVRQISLAGQRQRGAERDGRTRSRTSAPERAG